MTDSSARNALQPHEVSEGQTSSPALDSEPAGATPTSEGEGESTPPAASTESEKKPSPEPEEAPLHPVRGTLLTLLGAVVPFCIMAADRHFGFSVPIGFAGCLISTIGVLDLVGTFDARPAPNAARLEVAALLPRIAEVLTAGVVQIVALRLAVAGVLPKPIVTAAVLITLSFLWMIVAGFRLGQALGAWHKDELGNERPLLERHGFWLVAINALLYLPLLGSYSLSDPWETHYGEVAREMLARDDWISLWWAQDGWFWSKPILDFWMQGLAFSLLGVRYMPDQMLSAVSSGRFPQPEWAARMPIFLLTVLGVYFMYKGVAKAFGRRAGFLGGLILTTVPYWYLIAHQTMTDMPYVAPLTAAMGVLLYGFQCDPDETAKSCRVGFGRFTIELSAFHLLFGVLVLSVLPQILYLLTRNVTLQLHSPTGFRWHLDEFFSGSGGGNCGLPGNEACRSAVPRNPNFQPWHGAALWSGVLGVMLYINREERRVQRLCYIAGWFFMALSAMAKGAPGLVLPIFAVGLYVFAAKRWRDLPNLELPSMVLVVALLILPWYVQMFMRHGQPFTDRLLFHDMYKRAFVHVHDTNTGDDTSFRYYVWQLGYGLFPWTGLVAAGLVWWLRPNREEHPEQSGYAAFLALWFIAAFSMFTISLTKFHHYIFPAVPPMAMLAGILIDRGFGSGVLPSGRSLFSYLGTLCLGSVLMVYGVSRFFPGSVTGALEGGQPHPARVGLAVACTILGVLWCTAIVRRFVKPPAPAEESAEQRYTSLLFGMLAFVSALATVFAGRDLFTTVRGDIEGQARLVHLFTYNYRRPWPESLNFNAVLTGFTAVFAVGSALLAVKRWRPHIAAILCTTAVVWCAWGVNVYHFKTAPHWGQRETLMAYYARRSGPDEPFVSYQMNWKGENFYTGNRTPAFVSSGQQFKDWLAKQKEAGVRVMFFTTEHSRIGSLKSELGQYRKFDVLTTPELNNKFFVARVEL